ncbi:phosphoadenosine phosphosulfate reductase domain-containing protein [Pelosinus propionicus]|uniref:Phosphoadenosine phosphosulfate reductase family protein n=1 Tax=Pelosinus propionicus DSM 13327 TaxID=1123291 RepID=A0A1I4HYS3_9FIRM|nr:phosphoadenosine phosphosulfate reductase family protein [Pelosinus propionicus]SFL46977.1 Phosphoadenosine phosphosulfate reductase family protein [Pelosinus propionicus DSM 13327]
MIRCEKCIMPETNPHIVLDEKGVCNICNQQQDRKDEDTSSQDKNFEMLKAKIEKSRSKNTGKYDCAVGLSGGKDSTMTLYLAKKELGLNPLAIFIDNGFALEEMYYNIQNVTSKLGVDLIVYKPGEIKNFLIYLLKSKKPIYYCRPCHELLDVYVRDIASKHGINLILGGYTKGQEYAKNTELYWLFDISDKSIHDELSKEPAFKGILSILDDHALYLYETFESMVQINPFQYMKYDDESIIKFLTREFNVRFPKKSWPADSTNCFFNYVSQHLAVKNFGYSQHETELSTLIRKGELSRERALHIINAPIPMEYVEDALNRLGLKYEDVI